MNEAWKLVSNKPRDKGRGRQILPRKGHVNIVKA